MMNWQNLKKSLLKFIHLFGRQEKKTFQIWKSIGIIFLCILLISVLTYLVRKEFKNLILFPSSQTINKNLLEKIQATDQIIFQQLSKLSICDEDIHLKQFQSKDGPIEWNYSLITVTLPPSLTFNQVKNTFKSGFTFFKIEKLKWHFFHTPDNHLKIDVIIQGFKTHQLLFSYPGSYSKQQKKTKELYRVSIVIDDLGVDYKIFKRLLTMGTPFTYSILPFQPYSTRIAQEAHEYNGEIILHLPLEPWDGFNQTINYGTLLTSMKREQLLAQLERNIDSVPHIVGISNHMGSKFTENRDKMEILLKRMKEKGLYFLDSRTTKMTVGYKLAKNMGIKAAKRDLFIDNSKDPPSIEKQLKKLPSIAKKNGGYAIAIGHPYPSTVDTLKKTIPLLEKQGVKFVPLSQLLK